MKSSLGLGCLGLILFTPVWFFLFGYWWSGFQFDRKCGSYLKMAGDAGSIETAKARLDKAIAYLEEEHLTKGSTWLFWSDPTYEIEPWYTNLKSEQKHLEGFPLDNTESDRNNALMKLREVVLDHGAGGGDYVTLPHYISLYPHNALYFWGITISSILMVVGIVFMMVAVATGP